MKTCTLCKIEKPFEAFCKATGYRIGLNSRCKECIKAYKSAWNAANSDRLKLRKREKYLANAEEHKLKCREWHELNPGKMREYKEKWRNTNPAKVSASNARWRGSRLKATPLWADHHKIALIYEEAQFCTEFFGIPFHVDHIIPLRSKLVCGLHWEANLRVMLGEENVKKSNRRWPDGPMFN